MSASETKTRVFSGEGVLQTPLRVEWQAAGGEPRTETTRLLDADLHGAAFALSEQVELGQMLKLTLPPVFESLRRAPDETQSETWALVWAVTPARGGRPGAAAQRPRHLTRVLFFGMDVPRDFVEGAGGPCLYVAEDDGSFRLHRKADAGERAENRRRESRIHLPYEVTAEVLDEGGEVIATELLITENVSRRGAALRTTLDLRPYTRVRLTCAQFNFTVNSVVRACRLGPDKIARMHVEFIDGQWPI
jgi:hypothetical protein